MCYLKGMMKISWTDRVSNGVLQGVKDDRNIAHIIKRGKANLTGHILHTKYPLKYVIIGKIKKRIDVTERWGTRCKQLLDDLKEMGRYWTVKADPVDHTLWRTQSGRGYGPLIRQTRECVVRVKFLWQTNNCKYKISQDICSIKAVPQHICTMMHVVKLQTANTTVLTDLQFYMALNIWHMNTNIIC
jgi:hypothetical protein